MPTLLPTNWIEKVKLDHFASPAQMTTLKFGEKQMVYFDVSCLAIKFPNSWEFFCKDIEGNEQRYGSIKFGICQYDDCGIISDFSILVKKEVADFFNTNYHKLSRSGNKQFHQTIQEKFGLEIELSLPDNTIYFNLFSDTDRTIDFGELADMVFKEIGLVN
mgnify:CR=1 FL=1